MQKHYGNLQKEMQNSDRQRTAIGGEAAKMKDLQDQITYLAHDLNQDAHQQHRRCDRDRQREIRALRPQQVPGG